MRGAAAGTGARNVDVRGVGRRLAAIGDDDRRAVVTPAEGHAWDVEFGAGVLFEIDARDPPRLVAGIGGVLDLRRGSEQTERVGKATRIIGVAKRHRTPLDLVAVEQPRRAHTLDDACELPA